jgi:hypothetical protein
MLVTCPGEYFITFKSLKENKWTESFDDQGASTNMKRKNNMKKQGILLFATWNVRGLSYKEYQLDDILAKKGIEIQSLPKPIKLKGSKETNNYLQIYSGVGRQERARAGIMIHKSLQSSTDSYKLWNERIIEVRIKLSRGYITVL